MSSSPPTHQLGDKVASVIAAVGLKRGRCRRCQQRQQALNEARSLSDVVKAVLTPSPPSSGTTIRTCLRCRQELALDTHHICMGV